MLLNPLNLLTCLTLASMAAGAPIRVAVLRDTLPGVSAGILKSIEGSLNIPGVVQTPLSMGQLGSKTEFGLEKFDCLVLAHGHNFTAAARENLTAFLKGGGDLLLVGGGEGFLAERFQGRTLVLPAFSRYEPYWLKDVERVERYPEQQLLNTPIKMEGRFRGLSAVGFTRMSAKFVPLLSALDKYGRVKGWASGLLIDYGEYKGSNMLLFGVSSPEFYSSPGFAQVLQEVLPRMAGTRLTEQAEKERTEQLAVRTKLKSPAPKGFIRLSEDGKHLVYPDGRRFFMIGANYHRSLNEGEWYSSKVFDDLGFEDDFRKAKEAGVNCIRLGPASRFYEDPEVVKECARKYGIYLLILLNWGTRQDFVENAERVARLYADEPMVLGYDIQNEPTPDAVVGLRYDGEKSPALQLMPYEKYAGLLDASALDRAIEARGSGRGRQTDAETRKDLAALTLAWGKAVDPLTRGSGSTFVGATDGFRIDEPWKELAGAVDATFDLWIRKHIEVIRKHDRNHLITLGHNSILQALPANRHLDFVSQHPYDWPLGYEQVMSNLTTMDRMAKLWPGKPITLGEFGYSNGVPMPDGRYLDFHTSALGELLHWLYALAHGYDGAKKWVLTDWHWDVISKQGDRGRLIQIYEAYFGMYYYDGNPHGMGRPKPVAHGMRFLREYVDEGGTGGNLEIFRADNPLGTGYRYKGEKALFVGDRRYSSPELEFESERPANVMVRWDGGAIRIMSTCDVVVRIAPEKFISGLKAAGVRARGLRGAPSVEGGKVKLQLLEGETVTMR